MIQIERIHIENFRGIRKLTLDIKRENFGIYGRNGTGKSGIVDAIEFALTGSVTRLTGKGTAGVSLKAHGPHVDFRNQPAKAVVVMTVFAPHLNKSFTIERCVATASKPTITPGDDAALQSLVAVLAEHPEFALSRREILKYVITEAGERAKQVQSLLRLDDVERVRASLQTILNDTVRTVQNRDAEVLKNRTQLLSALKVEEMSTAGVLAAVNERRVVLGLEPLIELGKDTSLKGGVPTKTRSARSVVKKATALADLDALELLAKSQDVDDVRRSREATATALKQLRDNPQLLRNLLRRDFFARGLDLLDAPMCPLCETEWDIDELKAAIQEKIQTATEAQALKATLQTVSLPLQKRINQAEALCAAVEKHGHSLLQDGPKQVLATWRQELEQFRKALTGGNALVETISRLVTDWRGISGTIQEAMNALRAAVMALPDASSEEEARDYLVVGDERLEAWRSARRQLEAARRRQDLAKTVSTAFEDTSKAVLTGIYQEVEADFSRYYAFIHQEDEAEFRGKLTPSLGKLGFEVDFHGRGRFPPGAYHSEGHQDSMGLVLYLALMKRILGEDFRFAILDDVLMSVDSGHRKEVCRLFKQEFPNTQLVFTTHDKVWLSHMIAEGLVSKDSIQEFRNWTVDVGPQVWDYPDVWAEIAKDVAADDVPGAAHCLRRFLEYAAFELSCRLRASVEMRSAQSYDLGDLLPNVIGRWNKLCGQAKAAAQSWGQQAVFDDVEKRHVEFVERYKTSNAEQVLMNPLVHYNEWASLGKEEFTPIAEAFRKLFDCFRCETCGAFFYVVPPKGNVEMLRCNCSAVSYNLKKK